MEEINTNKKKIIIIATLSLFLFFLVLLTLLLTRKKQTTNKTTEPVTKIEIESNKTDSGNLYQSSKKDEIKKAFIAGLNKPEIAKKTLSCLEKTKNLKGIYFFQKNCDTKNVCTGTESNHSGLRVIWAYFKSFQKTNNNGDLNKVIRDLKAYTSVNVIQNDFWNCKLMVDLINGKGLNQQDKENAKNICLYSLLRPSMEIEAEKQIELGLVKLSNLVNIKNKIIKGDKNTIKPLIVKSDVYETSYYASEFIGRYHINKQPEELRKAEFFFDQATIILIKEQSIDAKSVCTLGEASLDLYKVNKDKNFLDFAEFLWINKKIYEPNYDFTSKTICAFFTNDLKSLTKSDKYKKGENEIIAEAVKNNLDSKTYKLYTNDDGCFNSDNFDSQNRAIKLTSENGLLSGILLSN